MRSDGPNRFRTKTTIVIPTPKAMIAWIPHASSANMRETIPGRFFRRERESARLRNKIPIRYLQVTRKATINLNAIFLYRIDSYLQNMRQKHTDKIDGGAPRIIRKCTFVRRTYRCPHHTDRSFRSQRQRLERPRWHQNDMMHANNKMKKHPPGVTRSILPWLPSDSESGSETTPVIWWCNSGCGMDDALPVVPRSCCCGCCCFRFIIRGFLGDTQTFSLWCHPICCFHSSRTPTSSTGFSAMTCRTKLSSSSSSFFSTCFVDDNTGCALTGIGIIIESLVTT